MKIQSSESPHVNFEAIAPKAINWGKFFALKEKKKNINSVIENEQEPRITFLKECIFYIPGYIL